MADSVTSIYLDEEAEWVDSEEEKEADEIVFHNGACTLGEPTDDTRADQIGKDLQQWTETPLTSLHLNYSDWTKWGAHEICNYLEESKALEEVTFQFEKTKSASITSTRTLTSLGEALANNQTAKIRQLRLFWTKVQAKSIAPLRQFIRESQWLQRLVLVDVVVDGIALGEALRSSGTIQKLTFFNVSNPIISSMLQEMSSKCPASLRLLEFERSNITPQSPELSTVGLEALLKAGSCHVEQLKLTTVPVGKESTEGLLRGLVQNTSVRDLTLRECPLYTPVLQQLLPQVTAVQRLQLDCFPLPDAATVIESLRQNASITHCELMNLPVNCGPALQNVLANNQSLLSLKLNNADRVLANPQVDVVDHHAMECLAKGLRVNTTLQFLSFKALGLNQLGIQYLTEALLHRSRASLDLEIHWDAVSMESLDHFSRVLRKASCRLRHLRLELEDTDNVHLNAGMVRFLEGLERNPTLESVYVEPSTEDEGLAPPVFARLAHALIVVERLKKFVFLFAMDNERAWREMDPQIIGMVQSDLFVGLSKNPTLEELQFADGMYTSQTSEDREFWRDVSFFGMRNRLIKGLDTGTISDEIDSVAEANLLAQNMVMEEIRNRKPWTLLRWSLETDAESHELNELSLFFLCLQHLPHLLVAGSS